MNNGKGSKSRPLSIPYQEYSNNFDNIFRKKHKVKVQELPDKTQFIELPDDLINSLGWEEGQKIEWSMESKGVYLAKKQKDSE